MNIDIIIPWVDGADQNWLIKKNQYMKNVTDVNGLNGEDRFRDTNLLEFVLLSIERNMPWAHHIFLVTDEQKPNWFVPNKKISIVDHKEFIPQEFLPTFNSNVIELNAFRIPNLSEHFILFNDDTIINKPVNSISFFSKDGIPKDSAIYSVIPANNEFSHTILNNMIVTNKSFNKWSLIKKDFFKVFNFKYGRLNFRSLLTLPWSGIAGFYNFHIPLSYTKSSFQEFWQKNYNYCKLTSQNKFRSNSDISNWGIRYAQLQSGNFVPRKASFGKFYLQNETERIVNDLEKEIHTVLCINDDVKSDLEKDMPPIIATLRKKFSSIS